MPPRSLQALSGGYPSGIRGGLLLPVRDVVGVPTNIPGRTGPYIARNVLTGLFYAFDTSSWYPMGRDYSAMGLIQSAFGSATNNPTPTLPAAPTIGSIRIAVCSGRNSGTPSIEAGWTLIGSTFQGGSGSGNGTARAWYRVTQAGDSAATVMTSVGNSASGIVGEFGGVATIGTNTTLTNQGASTTPTFSFSPAGSGPWIEVAAFTGGADGAGNSGPYSVGAGWSLVQSNHPGGGDAFGPGLIMEYAVRGVALAPVANTPNSTWGAMAIALSA